MSIQVLLPRDTIIRQLCICLNNNDIPINYRTKDGTVKDRNAKTLLTGQVKEPITECLRQIKSHFAEVESKKSKGIIEKSSFNRTLLDGNYQAWLAISDLIGSEGPLKVIKSDSSKSIENDLTESLKVSFARRGKWCTEIESQRAMNDISLMVPTFSHFESIAAELEEVRDRYNHSMSKAVHKWKRDGQMDDIVTPDIYSKEKRIKFYQVGSVVVVYIKVSKNLTRCRVMSNVHYTRIIEFIRSSANLALSFPYVQGADLTEDGVLRLLRKLVQVAKVYPNGVGGIFKSARQILFLEGDKEGVMGRLPRDLYISGLTGGKLELADEIASFLFVETGNRKSALNLANIFKMVIHPDAEMDEVFESIEGVKEPNVVDIKSLARFEGIARKAIYASLVAQRIDVRARVKDPDNSITVSFVNSINSTSTPVSSIMQAGYTKWSGIEFEPPRGIFDEKRQQIPVSNKSSAPNVSITKSFYNKINQPKTITDLRMIRERLRCINDVVSELEGVSELSFLKARARFREVIKEHETFELEYLRDGLTIDDITSEQLEEFVLGSSERSYAVATEPKLGEVHKEVTRMFYIAEQALKVMTQVCERFTKKVISKASGVSIVKSYRARRKELEGMLNSYTGHLQQDDGDISALYISFDMSEFSKKFPNSLIRILGKVMSELSGEDWMSRIDIFFRAAVVYNSSRGFSGALAGVRGGFEGFLNFLWTLAMRIVMDIATQASGVEGVLAVYSDDGLLRLYIGGTNVEVQRKVQVIRSVFKDHGLIFHLDKTVASYELMEYLGVYAEKGMIIPTWVKELMSIGKRKQTPGLETVADKVQLWDSQTSALVKAGGPPDVALLLSTFLTVRTIRRLNLVTNSSILATMTLIPFSAGGFRVSSLSEKCLLSSIEPLSEFCADIELLAHLYPAYSSCIMFRVLNSLKTGEECENSLLNGSLLQTSLTDTSGMSILRELIDSSDLDQSLTANPLTKDIRKRIINDIKNSRNFSPRDIKNLIQVVPDVIEYNKSIAIMKSSAALKFVTKYDLARAQRKDTVKCKNSISEWSDELKNYNTYNFRANANDIARKIISTSYPDFGIANLKESPRVALIPTTHDADILTNFEIITDLSLTDQEYVEPEAKFLGAQLSPEYSAESTANTAQRRNERFVATAARTVASNPSMLYLYYSVANAFGLPCPALPAASVISSHRSSKNFGENAVSIFLPVPFHALISSRMSNSMWGKLSTVHRTDRTTYVEAAKIATYLNLYYKVRDRPNLPKTTMPLNYNLRNMDLNTSNPVLEMSTLPDAGLIDNKATSSFHKTLIEQGSQEQSLESSVFTSGILETLLDTPAVKGILLNRLETWLYNCVNVGGGTRNLQSPARIPTNWMSQMYIEAIMHVSFRMSSPITRATITKKLMPFIRSIEGIDTNHVSKNPTLLNEYSRIISGCGSSVSEVQKHINTLSGAICCLDMDNTLKIRLQELSLMNGADGLFFIDVLKRLSVTGGVTLPTTVINTETFATTGISKVVKNSISENVYTLLHEYLAKVTSSTSPAEVARLDQTVNFLVVLKNMLRKSGHRNTPFNKHTTTIQLIKFEIFIEFCLDHGITAVSTYELQLYRLPMNICQHILDTNAVVGGMTQSDTGQDMRKILLDEGIPPWALSRANYILDKLKHIYKPKEITSAKFIANQRSFQDAMSYVMNTYNFIVKESVKNLDIRHIREADSVSSLTFMSPVEEASLVCAEVNTDKIIMNEIDPASFRDNSDYQGIVCNLFLAHYSRWNTAGYYSKPELNDMFKQYGIFNPEGSGVEMRSMMNSPMVYTVQRSDYELTTTSYQDRETAVHNYLAINTLSGGIAVIAHHLNTYYVIGITPKGTLTINTLSTKVPIYKGCSGDDVIVYSLRSVNISLMELSRVLGARPRTSIELGEVATIALTQAYQRQIGATGNIVEEDICLCAIAEIVNGAWSLDTAYRLLGLFCSWITSTGKVIPKVYRHCMSQIAIIADSDDAQTRLSLDSAASAVWSWVRNSRIISGPNIDTNMVLQITEKVGKFGRHGGVHQAVFNLVPRPVEEIINKRGTIELDLFIVTAPSFLNYVPMIRFDDQYELEVYSGDSDEDWDA